MFELTFGKLIVVICATTTAVGKAGVPPLAKSLGYQFGRVVGLLQGVKVKLEDVVDSNSEIKEMGKELHSELRKLDSVRTEFAIAAGSVGGGGVGNMLRNRAVSNLTGQTSISSPSPSPSSPSSSSSPLFPPPIPPPPPPPILSPPPPQHHQTLTPLRLLSNPLGVKNPPSNSLPLAKPTTRTRTTAVRSENPVRTFSTTSFKRTWFTSTTTRL